MTADVFARAALAGAALLMALGTAPARAQDGSIALRNNFPIGSNGLCEAQILDPQPGAGLFDRAYSVVCRDAAAPVGTLWVVRGKDADPRARFLSAGAACDPADESLVPAGLTAAATLRCRESEAGGGGPRVLAYGETGGRLYAAQSVAAYRDVVLLGLATLAGDRVVAGKVEIPLTQSSDAAAFARAQAQAISADAALAEAYRRSNAGSFAEAAEFFAQSAAALPGSEGTEARLNAALQQSNLGNFAESERLFAGVREPAANSPVLARMLRNYEALDALNAGDPRFALDRLAQPLPRGGDSWGLDTGTQIGPDLASRLAAEQASLLEGTGALTAMERAEVLDGQALYITATAHRLLGDDGAAAAALTRADTLLAGVRSGRILSILWLRAQAIGELAELRERAGDVVGAEAQHRRAVALLEGNYPDSPALLSARALLGGLYARTGRREEARAVYRELVETAGDRPATSLRRLMAPYFALLADSGGEAAAADMLHAGQLLLRPGLAQTQAVLARELSGGSDAAAQLFRKAVNLGRAVEQARSSVAQLTASAGGDPLLQGRLAEKTAELAALEEQQLALQGQLGDYPRYRVVSDGRLRLADLQAALEPGEGYAKLVTLDDAAYGVLATREGARAWRIGLSPARLDAEVEALRASIARAEGGRTRTAPFDIARARALYTALFGPVDGELRALTHLVFEPDGAMLRLPANLLVTDDASVARYRDRAARNSEAAYDFTGTAWLGRALQISTAVSPGAFRDVRRARPSDAPRPYLGLGENAPLGPTGPSTGTRAALAGGEGCLWAPAVWNNPIRSTELVAAARSLGGEAPGAIVTGAAFSDTALLAKGDLDQFRILHFATHGLVTAPSPDCPPRPALLTSFGEGASDGLLSFAEIFDLSLDADLVILSACDTAGEATVGATREAGLSGGGGFALDGLVRAFVGAGGRTVVASHWPVPDDYDATNRLIQGLFAAPPGATIAGALKQAEAQLMDRPETSHPFYWAAFAVIGDGGRALKR